MYWNTKTTKKTLKNIANRNKHKKHCKSPKNISYYMSQWSTWTLTSPLVQSQVTFISFWDLPRFFLVWFRVVSTLVSLFCVSVSPSLSNVFFRLRSVILFKQIIRTFKIKPLTTYMSILTFTKITCLFCHLHHCVITWTA